MPISKADAMDRAQNLDAKEYARLTEHIDLAIQSEAGRSPRILVGISGISTSCVAKAIEEYEALGWTCESVPNISLTLS